jgi:hypothetical protein
MEAYLPMAVAYRVFAMTCYRYGNKFMDEYQAMMTRKLGLPKYNKQLISKLLNNMAVDKVDYTNFFRLLSNVKADPKIPEDELLVPLKAVLLDIGQERKEAWMSWVQSYVHEVKYTGIISSVWITIFTMLPLLFSKLLTVFAPGYIWLIVSFAIMACSHFPFLLFLVPMHKAHLMALWKLLAIHTCVLYIILTTNNVSDNGTLMKLGRRQRVLSLSPTLFT